MEASIGQWQAGRRIEASEIKFLRDIKRCNILQRYTCGEEKWAGSEYLEIVDDLEIY